MAKTAKIATKAVAAPPMPPPVPVEKKKRHQRKMDTRPRLPDGTRFEVEYDAASETWSGVLFLRDGDRGPDMKHVFYFHNNRPGVFTLLTALDTMYRQHLSSQTS